MKNKINDGNGLEHTEYIEKYIYEKKGKLLYRILINKCQKLWK